MFIECDRCKQSFSEEDLDFCGSTTLCRWCKMELDKKKFENEDKLTYENIARYIDIVRSLADDEDDI